MRRILPFIVFCLLAGLALTPQAGEAGPIEAPDAPVQADPSEPVLEASVFGSGLLYRTLPGAQVLVELRNEEGEVKGSSAAVAGDDGVARINFGSYVSPSGNVAVITFGGSAITMVPGDRLRLLQVGAPEREIEIPNLTADIDVETDRVAGTGPAGASITAEIGTSDERFVRSITVGADGRWTIDFSDLGSGVLAANSAGGRISLLTAENYQFRTQVESFRSDITLGANQLSGSASSGTEVALTVETTDGQSLDYGPTTVIDGRWSLQLGSSGGFGPIMPGPGPGQGPPPHRFGPGDLVTISQSGGPMAADRGLSTTLPEITLDIDPEADVITGLGPAGGDMQVLASSVWQKYAGRNLSAEADGSFTVDFAGEADLGPGWRVNAWWQAEAALRVGAAAVIPVVQAGVDIASLSGLAEPGQRVTVTLRSGSGQLKSEQITTAGADGSFAVQHRPPSGGGGGVVLGGSGIPAEQGDRIEVEMISGDPLLFTVPELTAVTDALSDTVKGRAPAEASLRLAWGGTWAEGQVGEDGSYSVDLAGKHDIAPGSLGRLTVWDSRGHSFFTPWSAPRLSIQVGEAGIGGTAAPGRRLEATLLAPGGAPVAEAETTVQDFSAFGAFGLDPDAFGMAQGSFFLAFQDIAGDPVPVMPGDTVRVYSGDEMAQVVVPPLDGTVLVDSDLVSGRTEAGRALSIQALPFGGGRVTVDVTADENGNFSHEFAGQPDLRYNDVVGLATDVGGHAVGRTITIPGLTLDLDASRLSGTIWLNTRYILEARRDGAVLATARSTSGPDGEFSAQLLDADGKPVPLREGDLLSVIQITRQGGAPLTMTVPELKLSADPVSDNVAGLATPGGRLVVLARSAGSAFGISQSWPEIGPDGSWQADFIPAWDVEPGTAIAAQYRLPEGHVALRTYYVPQLRAEINGPNVCGFTLPGGEVTAFLREGTTSLASARATARFDGRFQAVLGNPRGELAITAGGQNVGADLGAGTVANLILPDLELSMDWQSGMLTGSGPADSSFTLGYPARRCMENVNFGGGLRIGMRGRSDPDGTIQTMFPLPVAPGDGIELSLPRPDGHESYLQLYRPLGQVYVDTARVTGKANAGAMLGFKLIDPDLQTRGLAEATADANGGFEALIRDEAGDLVAMQPDDTLEISMGGSVVARIVVEPLAFDWSQGEPIFGTAKPSRQVLLQLKLQDGRVLSIQRVTSGNGQWSFTAAEVPPRATWSLDEVESLRATIDTLDGHQIIFQTPGFEPDEPAPRPPTNRLYLPWLGRSVLTRATLEGAPAEPFTAEAASGSPLHWRMDSPVTLPAIEPEPLIQLDSAGERWLLRHRR